MEDFLRIVINSSVGKIKFRPKWRYHLELAFQKKSILGNGRNSFNKKVPKKDLQLVDENQE